MKAAQRLRRARGSRRRRLLFAGSVGARAAGAEGAARRQAEQATASCRGSARSCAPRRLRLGTLPIRPAVYGCSGAIEHRRRRCPSRRCGRHTSRAISSARPAITDRSCVIQISAVPCLAAELLHLGEDLRLDGDVERGGGLVGDQQVGLVQQRDGDGDALAHAAGELVRIGASGARRGSGCRPCRAHRARGARASACETCACALHRLDHLRVDAQHRIERHHRVLEDHRDAVAAQRRACRARDSFARSWPWYRIAPPTMRPGGSTRPRIEKPVTVLPEPDSPTRPSTCPRATRERHVVHRLHHAGAGEEMRAQVCAPRASRSAHRCSRGLSTSRNWSPTRLIATMVTSSAMPGIEADPVLARQHVLIAVGDQQAERRLGDRHAEAEERQRRLERDRARDLHAWRPRSAAAGSWAAGGGT